MSSPVVPRLSSRSSTMSSSKHEEELINAYEAEEERIINVLSRKLEQLKEEKIQLENALEAESESHVNRLTRELATLRAQQQQQLIGTPGSDDGREQGSLGLNGLLAGADPRYPAPDTLLEALRRENEALRNRLVDMERDYIKVVRQNDIYREELIDHRRRLGLSVDNLVGLGADQPLHRRSSSTTSSSPTASMIALPSGRPSLGGMPIPRPPSQIHRPSTAHPPSSAHHTAPSATTTPQSVSPGSSMPTSPNPFPFSPSTSANGNVGITASSSYATQITTPPSSSSVALAAQVLAGTPIAQPLTYPSVPPPSLSSSLGSPTVAYAPISLRHSRHSSVERGARVAETGSLSRRGSVTIARPRVVPEESVPESGSPPVDMLLST